MLRSLFIDKAHQQTTNMNAFPLQVEGIYSKEYQFFLRTIQVFKVLINIWADGDLTIVNFFFYTRTHSSVSSASNLAGSNIISTGFFT